MMNYLKRLVRELLSISVFKTLYFNFASFPFKTAMCIPVYVYRRVRLSSISGKIIIDCDIKRGMLKIGKRGLGAYDLSYAETIWGVAGKVVIKGSCVIGRGCRISVEHEAVLTMGSGFRVSGYSDIICTKSISFGKDCLISWDVLIMDSDFHSITDENGVRINNDKTIS